MVLKALNFDYSTKPSIIYMACCKIVLMFYNGMGIRNGCLSVLIIRQLFFIPCYPPFFLQSKNNLKIFPFLLVVSEKYSDICRTITKGIFPEQK